MKKLFLGVLLFIGMLVIPFSVVKFEADEVESYHLKDLDIAPMTYRIDALSQQLSSITNVANSYLFEFEPDLLSIEPYTMLDIVDKMRYYASSFLLLTDIGSPYGFIKAQVRHGFRANVESWQNSIRYVYYAGVESQFNITINGVFYGTKYANKVYNEIKFGYDDFYGEWYMESYIQLEGLDEATVDHILLYEYDINQSSYLYNPVYQIDIEVVGYGIGYDNGYNVGYNDAKDEFAYNAGNGDLIINEKLKSTNLSSYYEAGIPVDVVDSLGFKSSVYDGDNITVFGNRQFFRQYKAVHDDIVIFNPINDVSGNINFFAPFGYVFTKVKFILRNTDLPSIVSGKYADRMLLTIDNMDYDYGVDNIIKELNFNDGRHIITFTNNSTNNNPLTIGNIEFTLTRVIPQGYANGASLLTPSRRYYEAYGGWLNSSSYYYKGIDIGISEVFQKGFEVYQFGLYDNEDSFTYKLGYNEGLLSDDNQSYDAGYKKGTADANKYGFEANLHKWIVPAIILVLIVGGAMYFIKGRREY